MRNIRSVNTKQLLTATTMSSECEIKKIIIRTRHRRTFVYNLPIIYVNERYVSGWNIYIRYGRFPQAS